ncbi:hypothetical protein CVT24_003147 [Panaeolus cyanescens]|uniref:Uncharacterized protein n=1 Tax=Panaeolus cyanescens TaxID=181874 RepID=A0A409VNI3_9AGAR|nr:hypothetical protein CVT24_003147 [Panaeolus cyanescens]
MQSNTSSVMDQTMISNDELVAKDREATIASLDGFIRTQRAILERQRSDIERLRAIKGEFNSLQNNDLNQAKQVPFNNKTGVLDEKPSTNQQLLTVVDSILSNDENKSALHISEQVDLNFALPKRLKWTCFEMCDTTRLRTLHQTAQLTTADRLNPRARSSLPPSDLQAYIRQARTTMVEPILAKVEATILNLNKFMDDSDYETDEEERTRQREREKIRELMKKKRLGGGLSLPSNRLLILEGGEGDNLDADGDNDVHIRRDVEDESIEVDIADTRSTSIESSFAHLGGKALPIPSHGGKRWPPLEQGYATKAPPPEREKNSKVKRKSNPKKSKSKRRSDDTESEMEVDMLDQGQLYGDDYLDDDPGSSSKSRTTTKGKVKTPKPKPETYKQAWTDSEQNLLEQLLDQIPEGEKFRWQKISRAMGGRRTPRQVASRVQKYFEKLKRFGVVLSQGAATVDA